jgi:hypothetical protein
MLALHEDDHKLRRQAGCLPGRVNPGRKILLACKVSRHNLRGLAMSIAMLGLAILGGLIVLIQAVFLIGFGWLILRKLMKPQ